MISLAQANEPIFIRCPCDRMIYGVKIELLY
jgi:hypothetical protein